jgi:hypothetical protein
MNLRLQSLTAEMTLKELQRTTENLARGCRDLQNSCEKLYHQRNRELYRVHEKENAILRVKSLVVQMRRLLYELETNIQDINDLKNISDSRQHESKMAVCRACLDKLMDELQQVDPRNLASMETSVVTCGEITVLVDELTHGLCRAHDLRLPRIQNPLNVFEFGDLNRLDACVIC